MEQLLFLNKNGNGNKYIWYSEIKKKRVEFHYKDYSDDWWNKRIKKIDDKYSRTVLEQKNDTSLVEFHDKNWHYLSMIVIQNDNLIKI